MSATTAPECAELAERALAEADDEAAAAQVTVTRAARRTRGRTADGAVTVGSEEQLGAEFLCVRDGHLARAFTSACDPESLRAAARRAALDADELAADAPPGDHPGLAAPAVGRPHGGFDPETARLDPDTAKRGLAAAGEASAACFTARRVELAMASSTGLRASERATVACLELRSPGGGRAQGAAFAAATLDSAALLAEAEVRPGAETASAATHAPDAVVIEAEAVAAVLRVLGACAFNGLLHAAGAGALAGRLGTRVASAAINLSDSPRHATTLPRSIDPEGVPKAPLPLIQDGVAHRVVHDRRSAVRAGAGAASTGHALVAGGASGGPAPRNLVLVGGGASGVQELATPVGDGLLIDRLHDVHVLDPRTARFCARTAGDAHRIENGVLAGHLPEGLVVGSALEILAAVEALGARTRLVPDTALSPLSWPTGVVCPPLRTVAGLGWIPASADGALGTMSRIRAPAPEL